MQHATGEERTFHIFYQLLASHRKTEFWSGLEGCDRTSFCYVGGGGGDNDSDSDTSMVDTIEGVSDGDRFEQTLASLRLVGVTGDKLTMLMQAICIVLQLGNLVFAVDPQDEARSVIARNDNSNNSNQKDTLAALCELMGVPEDAVIPALTVRTVTARQEEFKVPLTAETAKDSCDAFAKEIYNTAFLWLVRSVNDATAAEYNYEQPQPNNGGGASHGGHHHHHTKKFGTIGLLDIFGFESFGTNRFEQLCINYANEKLQQKFTQDVFRSVQAEYEYEGIALGEITYDDNTDVLDLIESRMGLVAFLNEECVRPGGSDKGFVAKSGAMNKDNACFIRENGFLDCEFGIHHYAGRVVYDANGFVTKNMDTLPTDLQECATKSTNAILAQELGNDAMMNHHHHHGAASKKTTTSRKQHASGSSSSKTLTPGSAGKRGGAGSNLVGVSVFSKFRGQLSTLMTNLKQTRTRYIRCIKPNAMKKPLVMQHRSTVEQLRCAGVVAAVTISRSAFPNRLEHSVVLDRFKAMWGKGQHLAAEHSGTEDPEDKTKRLVDTMMTTALKSMQSTKEDGTEIKAFVMGKTRTYFRAGALEYLENERVKCLSRWAVEIQRIGRQYIARSRYTTYRAYTIALESAVRMLLARRCYLQQRSAAVEVQCFYRCVAARLLLIARRRCFKATLLQTHWRMAVAVTRLKASRRAAVVVQSVVRGALQRPKYRVALVEKREEAKLENQVLALQRKLEEAEKRRVDAETRAEERARGNAVTEQQQQTTTKTATNDHHRQRNTGRGKERGRQERPFGRVSGDARQCDCSQRRRTVTGPIVCPTANSHGRKWQDARVLAERSLQVAQPQCQDARRL